ncbi:MAG: 1,4-dihydroxy-2-naphthoate octaprenyltransferase [Sedimentisphaerales bacterium]|nr:1,4-dihydroxy-2-naphthoate octaprenyltransferase [Sedimentisphaerales bacterium]
MQTDSPRQKLVTLFLASRPQFLTASIAPVLVGSALGFAVAGTFDWPLFLLALFAIMFLHAGANIANDYFDHLSGNDWVNKNVTTFSGGRQFIQQGIISPKTTLLASLFCLTIGTFLGVIILLVTRSIFILVIGLAGILGGFFYTAPPVKLGYRGIGEIFIAFLFGILPVYGSYYLQAETLDIVPLPSACIVGILIFLVILINEFPDLPADAAVNKKTLVVLFGVLTGVWIYRIAVISTFLIALAGVFLTRIMFHPFILYFLFCLPLAVAAIGFANTKALSTPGLTQHRASAITIILHIVGSLSLSAGFLIWGFVHR